MPIKQENIPIIDKIVNDLHNETERPYRPFIAALYALHEHLHGRKVTVTKFQDMPFEEKECWMRILVLTATELLAHPDVHDLLVQLGQQWAHEATLQKQ